MQLKPAAFLLIFSLCAACAPQQTPGGAPVPPTAQSQPEFTPIPTLTASLAPTVEPGPRSSAATPYVPFVLANTVENTVLRAAPGPLFDAKTTLAQNTRLTVIGISPGREWVFVITPFDTTGWVFAGLLETKPELASVPLVQPPDVQIVRGQVLGQDGHPISGIQFALIEGVGAAGSPPRTDAVTDADGIFYAFLPPAVSGTWTVSFTAVACTSSLMDAACQCITGDCGKPEPEITTVTLPAAEILTFGWK